MSEETNTKTRFAKICESVFVAVILIIFLLCARLIFIDLIRDERSIKAVVSWNIPEWDTPVNHDGFVVIWNVFNSEKIEYYSIIGKYCNSLEIEFPSRDTFYEVNVYPYCIRGMFSILDSKNIPRINTLLLEFSVATKYFYVDKFGTVYEAGFASTSTKTDIYNLTNLTVSGTYCVTNSTISISNIVSEYVGTN